MRRLDEARAWLARFRASGTLTQGKGYGSLLQAYVAAKRVDDAVSLIEEMEAGKVAPVPNDVARIITGRLKADDLVGAGRLLDAAASVGVHADESTLRELLWAHARKGEAAAVERTMLRLTAAGITPDERHEKARAGASGETPRRLEDTAPEADTAPEGPTMALDDAAPAAEVSAESD
jgi:pentatricopeptide repeat protein